ncbi:phosphonate metabolism transcriptional regulator PhnF [Aestuariispira insulae]|uniref:GntR family transcriptional regulator n=1 Tax=Aestuariispira insulae TaxID=1461337 RepID=A0A3D9H5U1_9PROT|nr:phosphonate metabolism transcriptional regulator PhnF [Aestuariispira insulae]RED44877.1 GntR family transcriptional regulator [Aestuariispira insulae]
MIDWQAGEAKWRQIERILKEEITLGDFPSGEKLPTELVLAKRFGVNRHTVRQAIGALADADLVRVEQGRGTFVQEAVLDYNLSQRTRFSQNVSRKQKLPHKRLLEWEETKARGKVARNLQLKEGMPVLRLFSVSEADGIPVCCSESFLPGIRFEGLEEAFRETGSLTEAFKSYGIADYQRKETRITSHLPTARIAELLRQPKTRPILLTENIDIDMNGGVIETGFTSFASDRVQLIVGGI